MEFFGSNFCAEGTVGKPTRWSVPSNSREAHSLCGSRLPTANFRGGFAIFGHGFGVNLMISTGEVFIPTLIEFWSFFAVHRVASEANLPYFLLFRPPVRRRLRPCGGVVRHFPRSGAEEATRAWVGRPRRCPAVRRASADRPAASDDGMALPDGSA